MFFGILFIRERWYRFYRFLTNNVLHRFNNIIIVKEVVLRIYAMVEDRLKFDKPNSQICKTVPQ